jgi:hypothetical protein
MIGENMANPSNLYAEKIFSEHPIALWSLDDKVDYVSLITDNKRKVYLSSPDPDAWQISNGTKEQYLLPINSPMPETTTTLLLPEPDPAQKTNLITLTSSEIVSPALLSSGLETFSLGAYIYAQNDFSLSYEIGYIYEGISNPVLRKFESQIKDRWIFISETFPIPQTVNPIKIVIRITHVNVGASPDSYKFYINGITMGQWSEDFSATSTGVFPQQLPTGVPGNLPGIIPESTFGISATSYGLQESLGYYLSSPNVLYSKNSGVPLVYGSSNVTRILPNPAGPSLIVPGYGFLNETGRYRDYTAEMWLRIDSKATTARRIFGPVGSDDGVYVDGPFIKIKIGNNVGAHPVTEWFRPMLLDFKVSENFATLLINGEQVISLSYLTKDLPLPQSTSELPGGSQVEDLDWLGFYAYEDVPILELDCLAIYTYLVPSIVAKRRFAYGQAVEFPENENSAYGGTSVLIDYSFADYTANYSYPDIGRWSQASIENLDIVDEALSVPSYSPPVALFKDGTSVEDWYLQLSQIQDGEEFISLVDKDGYLVFERLDFLRQSLKGFYGIFKFNSLPETEEILLKLENKNDAAFLSVSVLGNSLMYKFKNGQEEIFLYSEPTVFANKKLSVGLDIEKFSSSFNKEVSQFLNNNSRLRMYLLGDNTFEKTFKGRLNAFSFCSQTDMSKIAELFNDVGILSYFNYQDLFADYETAEELDAGSIYFQNSPPYPQELDGGPPVILNGTTLEELQATKNSYTLIPKIEFESMSMDVAISGFWKDYLPLSYFSQYVSDAFGKKYYDLDFIQFNVDYPALENYVGETFDTSKNLIKTYITFEYLKTNSSAKDSYFTKLPAPKNNVVAPGSEWVHTKYEVVDGTLIYPPKNVKIEDLSIVTHIDWNIPGVVSNPLIIKKLQYASQAFNEQTSNPVGTRFGAFIFPYLKYGSYFDYKSRNPYRIYKGSSPYLYLTKSSGIEKIGDYDPLVNRGFVIPVNQNLAESYKVIAIQAFMRYGRERFPSVPEQIFEIESKDTYIKFFLVANDTSGKRARIFGINAKTGRFENGIAFYLNGNVVREPVIGLGEWDVLGISFPRVLDFDSYVGGFRVTGPILINNISQYQSTNLQEIQRQTLRSWFTAKFANPDVYDWDFWNEDFTWNGVLVFSSSTFFGVNPEDIYKAYTGTNKIIVDDDRPIRLDDYQYLAYQDVGWQTATIKPV